MLIGGQRSPVGFLPGSPAAFGHPFLLISSQDDPLVYRGFLGLAPDDHFISEQSGDIYRFVEIRILVAGIGMVALLALGFEKLKDFRSEVFGEKPVSGCSTA